MSLSKPLFCLSCCKKETEVELKRCSRCKFVHYCSKQCQVKDFKDHKTICYLIANELQVMVMGIFMPDQKLEYEVLKLFLLLELGK